MRLIQSVVTPSIAICLLSFGQPANESAHPRAILVKPAGAPPYLRVDDCIRGQPCRQLDREQPVPVADGFMYFSILSMGIDAKARHRILLKIAGFAIPDAIAAVVREDAHTQRVYFLVDLYRYKHVPPANPSNIDVWVDGEIITARGVNR
jgi:hypothetical protein